MDDQYWDAQMMNDCGSEDVTVAITEAELARYKKLQAEVDRHKDVFKMIDDTNAENLRLKHEVEQLKQERKDIFWIMFQATQRKLPVQYRERRWKPESTTWVDSPNPTWNWTDYEYRIKAERQEVEG